MVSVHSPLNLLLTAASGQRVGIAADGTPVSEVPGGAVYRTGESATLIVPPGAYTASMVGTGAGQVRIEADGPAGTTTSLFRARKGARATLKLTADGTLPAFRFGGANVKPVRGTTLALQGLPATLRARRARQRADEPDRGPGFAATTLTVPVRRT